MSAGKIVGIVLGATVLAFCGLCLFRGVLLGTVNTGGGGRNEGSSVEITTCVATGSGDAQAGVRVTNGSNTDHSYVVTVAFVDDRGTELATGFATVHTVRPGQSGSGTASGTTTQPTRVHECRVKGVTQL